MTRSSELLDDQIVDQLKLRVKKLAPIADLWTHGSPVSEDGLQVLDALVDRLRHNYPFGDSRYIGQILKPPHPVAWVAGAVTALINPNNHALDGGPATAALEKEAVSELAELFGYDTPLGHLTTSGTIANLEALFVAREIHPEKTVVYSSAAHYTHSRMCHLIGIRGESIDTDSFGRMDLRALESRLKQGDVGTVVATLGTTGLGALDPVHEIVSLAQEHGARVHVDAAYGGFHTILAKSADPAVKVEPFIALKHADSIVVDPHKHGLQAYGCGAILFRDPSVGKFYAHDSPYTYFTSNDLHLGEISIECSRAGSAAAAFWATLQLLPLDDSGLGALLRRGREAALRIYERLEASDIAGTVVEPELDIVCTFPRFGSTSEISRASERAMLELEDRGWYVALLQVDSEWLAERDPGIVMDTPTTAVLRSCVMKPEHYDVADDFVTVVSEVFSGLAK